MQYLLNNTYSDREVCAMAAVSAVISSKGKVYIIAGRTFFWWMTIIFLTGIPMSIASGNVLLFLVAISSFYLAYSGIRFARNRRGIANLLIGVLLV